MLPQHQKLNFRLVHFLCDFCVISGRRKAAARLLQGTQGVCMTDIRVHLPRICLKKTAKLPQDHCAMTLHFIARLPQECCKLYNGRTAALRVLYNILLCLANLHDHLVAA